MCSGGSLVMEQLHISKLNGKLEDFQAIGSNTLTNPFCLTQHNPKLAKAIGKFVNKKYSENNHLKNICKICRKNPKTNIALWTKRKDIVQGFFKVHPKPRNLILVYSNPIINKPITKVPKYFNKVFNNVLKDDFKDKQNCTGQKCKDCLRCYDFSQKIDNNIIYEAVKRSKVKERICEACYSHATFKFRTNMEPSFEKNSRLFKTDLCDEQIPNFNMLRYLRISQHGELLDNPI
jgi:hypothetical protein